MSSPLNLVNSVTYYGQCDELCPLLLGAAQLPVVIGSLSQPHVTTRPFLEQSSCCFGSLIKSQSTGHFPKHVVWSLCDYYRPKRG
jgi:hypothetical protein